MVKVFVSDKPITVVQGDVTAAINNVHLSTDKEYPNYNVAGQRVEKTINYYYSKW